MEVNGMRRPGVVVGAVFLLALLFSLGAFAADPARIGQAEAFVELPEDLSLIHI